MTSEAGVWQADLDGNLKDMAVTQPLLDACVLPPVLSAAHALAFAAIPTPLISDSLDRLPGMSGLIRYNGAGKLVGTAFTVKTRPGDNLMVYQAMTMLQPGHVLVIDAGGDLNNAILGELMKLYCESRGCAGIVVDGAIRDVSCFASSNFPCYARGVSHRGPYKSGPGQINVPVAIGGQVVRPGDVVMGDEDGIVAFDPCLIQTLIERAEAKRKLEDAVKAEIASGAKWQDWLHGELARRCNAL